MYFKMYPTKMSGQNSVIQQCVQNRGQEPQRAHRGTAEGHRILFD